MNQINVTDRPASDSPIRQLMRNLHPMLEQAEREPIYQSVIFQFVRDLGYDLSGIVIENECEGKTPRIIELFNDGLSRLDNDGIDEPDPFDAAWDCGRTVGMILRFLPDLPQPNDVRFPQAFCIGLLLGIAEA